MQQNERESLVSVYEGVLTPAQVETCVRKLMRPRWGFDGGGSVSRFWHMEALEDDPFFAGPFLDRVRELAGRPLPHVYRIYANGQTAVQKGVPHRDGEQPGAFTFLYCSNPEWDPSLAGGTLFYDDDMEIIRGVAYVPNRGFLFPAHVIHAAEAPARHYQGLRTTVAFHLGES